MTLYWSAVERACSQTQLLVPSTAAAVHPPRPDLVDAVGGLPPSPSRTSRLSVKPQTAQAGTAVLGDRSCQAPALFCAGDCCGHGHCAARRDRAALHGRRTAGGRMCRARWSAGRFLPHFCHRIVVRQVLPRSLPPGSATKRRTAIQLFLSKNPYVAGVCAQRGGSSVGQSTGLIIPRSWVRAPPAPHTLRYGRALKNQSRTTLQQQGTVLPWTDP